VKGEGFHPTQPPLLRGVRHVGSSCASPRAAWWIVPRLFRMYGTQKRQRSKNTSYLDSLKLLYFKLLPFFLGVTIPYTHSFSELVLTFWCLSLCGRSHTLSPGCGIQSAVGDCVRRLGMCDQCLVLGTQCVLLAGTRSCEDPFTQWPFKDPWSLHTSPFVPGPFAKMPGCQIPKMC
jgi:hypothetical protein